MDNEIRKSKSQENWERNLGKIKPSKVIFFVNNNLVRLIHFNRANDICELFNFNQNKNQTMLYSDFKKHRKRAFTISTTLKIFNRSRMQLERWIRDGLIKPPTGAIPGGERKWQAKSYYSEDDLFTIRSVAATIHKGRPRKDGRITPRKDVPTEKELRSLIGDGIMLYTKTEDGRFIPVWQEETW
jgi:hypothetical protein